MKMVFKNCHAVTCKGNVIDVAIEKPDFAIEVTGFDPNRDLRVDVRPDYEQNNAGILQ